MRLESPLLDPQVLARLDGVRLGARRTVEGSLAGKHRSPQRGFSVEFAEHRQYAPGDDLRYVDWKVYGKRERVYVKQYEQETELSCQLLIDTSESMAYRGPQAAVSKCQYACRIAAILAYLVLRQQDRVGLVTFDQQIRAEIRPSSHPSQLRQVLRTLEAVEPEGRSQAAPVLHDVAERCKRRSMIILLSDLFDDMPSVLTGLQHLQHRKHEVIVFHILDPAELEFPFEQTTLFHGLEQLGDVLAEPRALRLAYLREMREFLRAARTSVRKQQADYVLAPSDKPLERVLPHYLTARRKWM